MATNDLFQTVESMTVEELTREAEATQARVELLKAALNLKISRQADSPEKAAVKQSLGLKIGGAKPNDEPPSKRKAVLRLLAENPEKVMKLSAIAGELIRRGWIEQSSRSVNSLGITVSKMYGRGELERPKAAHYRITDLGKAVDTT